MSHDKTKNIISTRDVATWIKLFYKLLYNHATPSVMSIHRLFFLSYGVQGSVPQQSSVESLVYIWVTRHQQVGSTPSQLGCSQQFVLASSGFHRYQEQLPCIICKALCFVGVC